MEKCFTEKSEVKLKKIIRQGTRPKLKTILKKRKLSPVRKILKQGGRPRLKKILKKVQPQRYD